MVRGMETFSPTRQVLSDFFHNICLCVCCVCEGVCVRKSKVSQESRIDVWDVKVSILMADLAFLPTFCSPLGL